MRGARADRERLFDILDAIQSIKTHIASRRRLDDDVAATAAARRIEIVGEASGCCQPSCATPIPRPRGRSAVDMRNRLIHGYFDLNPDRIWDTIAA